MSTTYDELVANIKATSGRTDTQTINAIPQFIAAAQSRLDGELRIGTMSASVTYHTDAVSIDASDFLKMGSCIQSGDHQINSPFLSKGF